MEIILDKASSRGYADHGWLKTHHTFSFANYYNPERIQFGALRVLNEDIVAPNEGFGTHPHKNMEVISIPLRGYLRHGDSLKNSHVISQGQVQVMSTGTGIYHSEFNDSKTQELEFIQLWILPNVLNTRPKYNDYDITEYIKHNEISTFISPDGPISIAQEATVSWAELDTGTRVEYKLTQGDMGVYVFVIDGEIRIDDITLSQRDGMGISDTGSFEIIASQDSNVLLIEVPMMQ